MKTILVSGASGVVGYGVLRSLRKAGTDYKLIGTTIYDDSVAQAFCDVFEKAPLTTDKEYVNWLCAIIKKHHVDMIVPGIEADMLAWNESRERLQGAMTVPLLNNSDLITLCSDKWNFYKKLTEFGSKFAIDTTLSGTFESLKEKFGLPFLLKPRSGFASKGIVIVNAKSTFNVHEAELGTSLMAQPIIGTNEEEYTVSAFFDNENKLLCHMSLKRKLAKEGFTEKAQVEDLDGATAAIEELALLLKPVGPTNFQFRIQSGQLKLLEINPRISSATSIRTAFGYNESAMSIEYFINKRVPKQPKIVPGHAVRYVEDYIFYDSNPV